MSLRRPSSDDGLSLVELLVSLFMFVLLAVMVSTLLVNGFFMQQRVVNTTKATGDAQTAANAISYDVRFSSASSVTASGAMLRTRTWVGTDGVTGSYVCRGWYYNSADKTLRRATSSTQTASATTASAATWPVYAEGITAGTVFVAVDVDTVRLDFTAKPAIRGVSTEIDNTITRRKQPDTGSSPCF